VNKFKRMKNQISSLISLFETINLSSFFLIFLRFGFIELLVASIEGFSKLKIEGLFLFSVLVSGYLN
jgi:hypothetical protein